MINPPQPRQTEPLSELKTSVSDLRMSVVFLFSAAGLNLSLPWWTFVTVHSCCVNVSDFYSQKHRQAFIMQTQTSASTDFPFSCFVTIRLGCVEISLCVKYASNLCREALLKIYDQTQFWAFYLFSWIPAALCKCLHLPSHLCIVIIFYFKKQGRGSILSNETLM